MFEKLRAFYSVFQAGKVVANPAAWKRGQMTGGLVAGLLGALIAFAKVFGYDIPLSDEQLLQIGGAAVAVFGLFNAGATVATTDKLGLPGGGTGQVSSGDSAGAQVVPPASVAAADPGPEMPHVRRAANGDILDGLDTTYVGG